MIDTMRSVDDLRSFADQYDHERDCPFALPDENLLAAHSAPFLPKAQLRLDMRSWTDTDGGAECASIRTPAERYCERKREAELSAPASNTGPVKYRRGDDEKRPCWGGYDGGVEASIYGEWTEEAFRYFSWRLDTAKQCANDGDEEGTYCDFGGLLWKVSDKGAQVGAKYKWVLESHGVKLYIHSNPKGGIAPVHVRFGFDCLARIDLFDAVETLKKVLEKEGFSWESEILSRVDMQVLLDVEVQDFLDAMQGNRVVTQCRGKCEIVTDCRTMKVQTITFRSKNCELCIYDKLAQLEAVDSVYFMTFQRWILGGEVPEHLTRVEFRLRREMLKRYGVTTFQDLRESQQALPQVVGRDWFRILEREKVRGSEKEIKFAPIWKRTLDEFQYYFGSTGKVRSANSLRGYKVEKSVPKVEKVLKQAVGCLSSVASLVMAKVDDASDVLEFICQKVADFGSVLYDKTIERKARYEVLRGFTVSEKPDLDCKRELELAFVNEHVREYLKCFYN